MKNMVTRNIKRKNGRKKGYRDIAQLKIEGQETVQPMAEVWRH